MSLLISEVKAYGTHAMRILGIGVRDAAPHGTIVHAANEIG